MVVVNGKEKEKECNCCIKIEESIVVIICGEIEIERLKNCLKTVSDLKDTKILGSEEQV